VIPIGDIAAAVAVTLFVLVMICIRRLAAPAVTPQAGDEEAARRDDDGIAANRETGHRVNPYRGDQ